MGGAVFLFFVGDAKTDARLLGGLLRLATLAAEIFRETKMAPAFFARACAAAFFAAMLALALSACAPAVRSSPATMARLDAASAAADIRFTAPLNLSFGTGYSRQIPAGTQWRAAGRLPEGTVYRPIDHVFTVEGQQVHEAWLVIRDGAIQGFYLAAEERYAPLEPPVTLPKGN